MQSPRTHWGHSAPVQCRPAFRIGGRPGAHSRCPGIGSEEESAAGYGVEICRADVKDLVLPGNLREIMNRVLETERRAEAELIQARKDAEALKIKSDAKNRAQEERARGESERARLAAEADLRRAQLRVQANVEEAKALAEHPELVRLRELQALRRWPSRAPGS